MLSAVRAIELAETIEITDIDRERRYGVPAQVGGGISGGGTRNRRRGIGYVVGRGIAGQDDDPFRPRTPSGRITRGGPQRGEGLLGKVAAASRGPAVDRGLGQRGVVVDCLIDPIRAAVQRQAVTGGS